MLQGSAIGGQLRAVNGGELVIAIAGTRGDWPGDPRTPGSARAHPGTERDPLVRGRARRGRMPSAGCRRRRPAARGRAWSTHLIVWITPDTLAPPRSAPPAAELRPTPYRATPRSISPNGRRAYSGALRRPDAWLDDRLLGDATLAAYLAELHDPGASSGERVDGGGRSVLAGSAGRRAEPGRGN